MRQPWWWLFNQRWVPAHLAPWLLGKALGSKGVRVETTNDRSCPVCGCRQDDHRTIWEDMNDTRAVLVASGERDDDYPTCKDCGDCNEEFQA